MSAQRQTTIPSQARKAGSPATERKTGPGAPAIPQGAKVVYDSESEEEDDDVDEIVKEMQALSTAGMPEVYHRSDDDKIIRDNISIYPVVRETEYTVVRATPKGEKVQVKELGIIDESNYDKFTFSFAEPSEIENKGGANASKGNTTAELSARYRTATSAVSLVFPDGERTNTIPIRDCIIQYRATMKSEGGSYYGNDTLNIGIPMKYMSKLMKDGMDRASGSRNAINIVNKPSTITFDDRYWYSCDLKNLKKDEVGSITDVGFFVEDIRSLLIEAEQHILADITFTINVSHSVERGGPGFDKVNGGYTIAPKPVTIDIHGPDPELKAPEVSAQNKADSLVERSVNRRANKFMFERAMRAMKANKGVGK